MNAKIKFEAWIETGRTNGLYTLHRRVVGRPVHEMVREYTYVRNLGRTWDVACANADKYCDGNDNVEYIKDYDLSDECGTLRKAGTYDDNRFWFGKYEGNDIEDVIANDVEYIKFLRDNFDRGTGNPRMDSLLKKFDSLELGKSEREIENEARAKKIEEDNAKMKPVPVDLFDGRNTFVGEIACTKEVDGYYGTTLKMLIIEERGFKIWGTAPIALWDDHSGDVRGWKIEFDAALDASDKDDTFAFFKRPTKVSIIEKAA